MTSIICNSILNPLASVFVPSGKFPYEEETIVDVQMESEDSNTDIDSNIETMEEACTNMDLNESLKKVDVTMKQKKVESITMSSELSISVKRFKTTEKAEYCVEIFTLSTLMLLPMSTLIYKKLYRKKISADESRAAAEIDPKSKDCSCPPMFGWIVPPAFFGNPLNIKYACHKSYVHSARQCETDLYNGADQLTGQKRQPYLYSDKRTSLEQVSWEFQMIIKDVCNSVRDDSLEINSEDEVPDLFDESNELSKSMWDGVFNKTSSEIPIIDNEPHSLLESSTSEDSKKEEDHESIAVIENILEKCMSPCTDSGFDFMGSLMTNCNPPCSVWCDSLPEAARSTYVRYLKQLQNKMPRTVREKPIERPVCNRSLSADYAPKFSYPYQSLSKMTSEMESRERLMLLRHDPIAYFGYRPNEQRRCKSVYPDILSNCQARDSASIGFDSTWGPFGDANSLWKPLPDCVPTNEYGMKSNRKVRDLRRQKSVP